MHEARTIALPIECWVWPMHQTMRARPVLGHRLGGLQAGRLVDAAGLVAPCRASTWPCTSASHLVHAVDAVGDVLLVFPAVLEDVVQHAEQERDVAARADAHVVVGLGRGAREARVDHDHLAAGFLGMQHVQHRHRVRLGGVRADVHRRLRSCACRCTSSSSRRSPRCSRRPRPWWSGRCAPGGRSCCCPTG